MRPPRRLLPLLGPPDHTAAQARAAVADLSADDVIAVPADRPSALRRQLGRSASAVVLDLHQGLHADVLAAAPGFLHAGGTLVLRLPVTPVPPAHLRVSPTPLVARPPGVRTEERLRHALSSAPLAPSGPLPPGVPAHTGSEEQRRLVDTLTAAQEQPASLHAVIAPRGRGKSTALGQVLGHAHRAGLAVALVAPDASAAEVVVDAADAPIPVLHPEEALTDPRSWHALAVDEAARLPVPWLQSLTARHRSTLLFATTVGGYEGTGRGFVLRFLASLEQDPRPLYRHTLDTPIRWEPDDPLERWLDAVLLDDRPLPPAPTAPLQLEAASPERLATDEQLLAQAHALLQHAHYRTTPADLQRLLDGPNLHLHIAHRGGQLVGVDLMAIEGGLPMDTAEAMRDGALRVRGHALPDTLVSHCGAVEAGTWTWLRSVRLAVHPDHRRQGIARALVEHVHASYPDVDGHGTLFGAVPHVVSFRQDLGYHLVRLGASRGSRTGEPSAVMVRPFSDRARALVDSLGARLARDLDLLLELLDGDGELPLDPDLPRTLRRYLPPPMPLTPEELAESVTAYVDGPRPLEASATALRHWLAASDLGGWTEREQALYRSRLLHGRSWTSAARQAGLPHARAAMRALKRACRRLPRPCASASEVSQ